MQQGHASFQEHVAMMGLRDALAKRSNRIVDQALLTSLEFTPVDKGTFSAIARWEGGEHRVVYTPGNSLRRTRFSLVYGPHRYPFCRFADQLIREVLKARRITK